MRASSGGQSTITVKKVTLDEASYLSAFSNYKWRRLRATASMQSPTNAKKAHISSLTQKHHNMNKSFNRYRTVAAAEWRERMRAPRHVPRGCQSRFKPSTFLLNDRG